MRRGLLDLCTSNLIFKRRLMSSDLVGRVSVEVPRFETLKLFRFAIGVIHRVARTKIESTQGARRERLPHNPDAGCNCRWGSIQKRSVYRPLEDPFYPLTITGLVIGRGLGLIPCPVVL